MKATAIWQKKFQSVVTDNRGHQVVVDLPPAKNGDDAGPTAFELSLMALAGCYSTIFALVAGKSRVEINSLKVECQARTTEDGMRFTEITTTVEVSSPADEATLQRVLRQTEQICPVGSIFQQAQIPNKSLLVKK
ncbi:MAG: OsmC family protein [Candidatus Saccharicenans sp.]